MAVVNVNLNNMLNVKDSRWLQLEVCREFQRSKCSRSDCECKFAHPPPNVEVQNGRVIACYDSIKVSHSILPSWYTNACMPKNAVSTVRLQSIRTEKNRNTIKDNHLGTSPPPLPTLQSTRTYIF